MFLLLFLIYFGSSLFYTDKKSCLIRYKESEIFMNAPSLFGSAIYIKASPTPRDFSLYDPIPLFRREFELSEAIVEAQILFQSPGFAECFLNGIPITKDRFVSAVSDYRKILWYNTYDVTPLLRNGKNVLAVIAGNGFLNESFESGWHYPTAEWRDAPQFLLCLRVNGKECAVSDTSWKCSLEHSPIIYSHLRSGEYVDARKKDDAWMQVEYDDSDWQHALARTAPVTGELRPTLCQPVRECEVIEPIAVTKNADGAFLVDFGVTISGYIEITLQAERDSEIIFRYTEDIDASLRPKYNNMTKPIFYPESPFHINKLIASGGVDTFKPLFCYHGFRYVLIEGLKDEPSLHSMRAFFVHQDVARRSTFSSGNEVINYIYNAGIRSTYSNLFWSLTDCPTREKLGWANDAQYSIEQTLINFDILPLYEKWFEDLKSCMKENGSLPGIIPSPDWGFQFGPICDCLLYELPYRIYLYTGQTKMLIEAIPYFERYALYLKDKLSSEELYFSLGDWLGYASSKLVSKRFVQEFYLLKALKITAFAHRLAKTGNGDWDALYRSESNAFIERYLDEQDRCVFDEQSSCAMMLECGLYRDRKVLAEQLIAVIERDQCVLTSGMVGVQYLYDALAHCGRADLAYRMITESEPGYRTWFAHGATTLWERWAGEDDGSHNHHMFAGVIAWFYKYLLGIAPTENAPAFESIELKPYFLKELGFVRGSVQTVKGEIHVEWHTQNDGFRYTVTLPEGIRATFRDQLLSAGKNEFFIC